MGSTGSKVVALLLATIGVAVAQPETAFDWNQRGVAAAERGQLEEAEQDYQKALSLWRELGPAYQAHTAATLYNLGQTFVAQGRWRDSIPVVEEALDLSRRALSIRHVRTLTILNTLGRVYMVTGNLDRADAAFLEALGIEREIVPDQMQLAQTLGSLAALRTRENKLAEALIWGDEALALAIRAAGDDAPDTASLYAVVAAIHQRAGRPERALPLFRKAHAIYDRTIPPTDLRYPLLLTSEALSLMDDRRFSEAEKELRQAIKLVAPCASQCSFVLAIAENNFGLLRMTQKKYVDADTFLRSALAREEQYSMLPSGDILNTLKLLVELRELQHRHDESAALKQRIAEMESSYR